MSLKSDAVLYRVHDGIAEIRFNRPKRLNALGIEVAHGFADAVDRVASDPDIKVVVVSSEGRAFVAGGDLGHFKASADRRVAAAQLINPLHAALEKLALSSAVTIGSLKGAVAGAGMSIALNLDLVIAAEDVTFNLAYARVAASPDCGGSWALPRLVGYRRALEIALLSETLAVEEAHRLGLVNKIVPLAELEAETAKLAGRLASGASFAHGRIKRLMRQSLERSYPEQLGAEAQSFLECAATDDFSEALAAFFDKRKPKFSGG